VGVSQRLFAGSIQKHDFVLDTLALQIEFKFEPRILRDRSRSIVKFAQLND